jgi:hypothetical protein
MRVGAIILSMGICLTGCAARQAAVTAAPPTADPLGYEASTASALVFDPPVTAGEPPVELPRDERAMSAFVSFDGPITTFFWIHTDDSQQSDWGNNCLNGVGDYYERHAITDKSGVTYR